MRQRRADTAAAATLEEPSVEDATEDNATDDPHDDASVPGHTSFAAAGAPWLVVLVAVGVAVVSLAVAVAALLVSPGEDDREQDRDGALAAARERTLTLTSYDYRTLDENAAQVLETATGTFEREYTQTIEQLRETFVSTQAVSGGNVVAAGLESFTPDRAVVVVAVDQVIQAVDAAPRSERNRLRMSLIRPDDVWLVERVERL